MPTSPVRLAGLGVAVAGLLAASLLTRSDIPARLRQAVEAVGFRGATQRLLAKLTDYTFDVRYGTDTAGQVGVEDLDVDGPSVEHALHYAPTRAREFGKLLSALDLPRDCTFVDIGSGKGRVVLMAAKSGFRRVVGVEFSPVLCGIARTNVERFGGRFHDGAEIEIVESDATRYPVADDDRVFFMYHPFDEPLMQLVLGNIAESVKRCQRQVWLIYNNPVHRQSIEEGALFEKVGDYCFSALNFSVYTNISTKKSPGASGKQCV